MSNWLNKGEVEYLKDDNEWHHVLLDIADLMKNYAKHQAIDDPKEYAARAISFVRGHIDREEADTPTPPNIEREDLTVLVANAMAKYRQGHEAQLTNIMQAIDTYVEQAVKEARVDVLQTALLLVNGQPTIAEQMLVSGGLAIEHEGNRYLIGQGHDFSPKTVLQKMLDKEMENEQT